MLFIQFNKVQYDNIFIANDKEKFIEPNTICTYDEEIYTAQCYHNIKVTRLEEILNQFEKDEVFVIDLDIS